MAVELRPDFPLPCHVAVIMDGNGRWARRGGLARVMGHESGVAAVRDVTEAAAEWGIQNLTLYAFSVENWQRPRSEVEALMKLLRRFLRQELPTLLENGVRLASIGRLEDLPPQVLDTLSHAQERTAACDRMTLRLALSYGGRQELSDAMRQLAQSVRDGELEPADVTEESIAQRLYDPAMPDPDLVIRTAGEMRLSNFLLWQSSYAEFYFSPVLWPEFRREHLYEALRDYHGRVRRFGRVLHEDPAMRPPL